VKITRTTTVTRIQTQNDVIAILLESSIKSGETLEMVGTKMGKLAKIGQYKFALSY
jgi:hypothetical protein